MTAPRIPRRDPDYWPALGLLLTVGTGASAVVAFLTLVCGR